MNYSLKREYALRRKAGRAHVAAEETDRSSCYFQSAAESSGAKIIVETGTSTGYSGPWLCLALQNTHDHLTTFKIDEERASRARKHFGQAGEAAGAGCVRRWK